jgi:hypothetical protein
MNKPAETRKERQMRQRIAQEAARLMAESGMRDFFAAKKKAALHLGAAETRNLPRNDEIEAALDEYNRIFRGDSHPGHLRSLRETALEAMHLLAPFRPRLVGPVLSGSAGDYTDVTLHLFPETPEAVAMFLMDHHIPYDEGEARLRYRSGEHSYPVYRFVAGDIGVELVVFPMEGLREAPRSPVDGRPMRRAGTDEVRTLLDADTAPTT